MGGGEEGGEKRGTAARTNRGVVVGSWEPTVSFWLATTIGMYDFYVTTEY